MKREGEMTLDLRVEHSSFQAVRQRPTTPPTTWRSALKDYAMLFSQGLNSVGFTLSYIDMVNNKRTKDKWISETRKKLIASRTLYEKLFIECLPKRLRVKAKIQHPFMIKDKIYFVDVYFPQIKVAVEIDGTSHYGKEFYDKERDAKLRSEGISVLHISNTEVNDCKMRVMLIETLNGYVASRRDEKQMRKARLVKQRERLKAVYEEINKKKLKR